MRNKLFGSVRARMSGIYLLITVCALLFIGQMVANLMEEFLVSQRTQTQSQETARLALELGPELSDFDGERLFSYVQERAYSMNGRILLLDAGVQAQKIMRGIDHRLEDVSGCLITHEHMDHCRAVESLTALGVECYGSHGTRKAVPGLHATRLPISLDPFVCRCFPVCHDALDPCGWLILNRETGERMVYATDCCGLYNTFPGVHYWLIECNHMDELLSGTPPALARRLTTSHMSLARLLEVFAANDLTDCRKIVLCHGSRERLDPQKAANTAVFRAFAVMEGAK